MAVLFALLAACSSAKPSAGPGATDGGTEASGDASGPGPDGSRDATTDGRSPDAGADAAISTGVGAPCTSKADCAGKEACIPAVDYFPGGYCTLTPCSVSADCGPGGVCEADLFYGSTGLPEPICLLGCSASSTCRSGYFCDTSHGPGVCMPQDCRRSAAVCAQDAGACNEQTGGCVPSPLPAGYPASFPAPPQVQKQAGKVLATPTLVPIFFNNDTDPGVPVADMVAFFEGLGQTNYWRTLEEYGVGPVAGVTPVMLAQAAPAAIDDTSTTSALKQLLAGFIANATGGTPASNGSTVYVLVFPSATTVTWFTGPSCTSFGGYHDELALPDGTHVPYAVVPRCPGAAIGLQNDLQLVTGVASHELAEATTDPFVSSAPAWTLLDAPHMYFDEANSGAEIADLCENDGAAFLAFEDSSFTVQRIWSNSAAAAGHDPCVPAFAGETFFNSVPVLPDTTSFSYDGNNDTVDAVNIPVGMSAMIPIQLYSDGPTTAWTVTVSDYACVTAVPGGALLTFTLAPGSAGATCAPVNDPSDPCVTQSCTGSNGDTVNLTIDVVAAGSGASHEAPNTELFLVKSTQVSGMSQLTHLWWGIVGS